MKSLFFFLFLLFCLFSPLSIYAADTFPPTIGTISPNEATVGVGVTLSAPVSDSGGSGISTCQLYVDNNEVGAMTVSNGLASKMHIFPNAQIYTVFVFCRDGANNFNSGANAAVWAKIGQGGSGGDLTPPTVSLVQPGMATAGAQVTFTASVSDSGTGITNCQFLAGGTVQGNATVSDGTATYKHTFAAAGVTTVYMQCKDGAGNTGYGANSVISVQPASAPPDTYQSPVTSLGTGGLIKLACPVAAKADHPCKAVYFYGKDGKRHAFPNEKIYFTWYGDFSSVTTVTSEAMSKIPLGKNVTYRPGARMVKFPSVSAAYAVAKGGVLRWVKTEDDAKALYGVNWSKNIDDISEALFMDYSYGIDIGPGAPFSPSDEMKKAVTIDETL